MEAIYLMDPDRSFERQHNNRGWPFLMLVDDAGQIVYQCNNLVDRDKTFMRNLQDIGKVRREPQIRQIGDVPYLQRTLENNGESAKLRFNERFTSIACGSDGTVYTTYTSAEDGNSNVYLQIHQSGSDPNRIAVAATESDEYDSTVMTDTKGNVWLCWTGNSRGRTYNIYLNSLAGIRNNKPAVLISQSKEDCMHGRMAVGATDTIWITYYKWEKLNGISRDKEVYLRHYKDGRISEEIHISPEDVSAYEDHTDPSIVMLNNQPLVCWSWDFHQPDGYTKEAHSPTIFARKAGIEQAIGKAFHISAKNIDMTPLLTTLGDSLWCAWDSLGRSSKSLCVRQVNAGAGSGSIITIVDDMVNICSPAMASNGTNRGVLTWSQTENGKDWSLWKADFDIQQNKWSRPFKIVSEGNPRFGSCAYDADGNLWIACSVQTDLGRQVTVKQINE